ncbi:MAG TPA: outer membrane lipoprotein-sorting protein [bacterium]|nr:outer membrane lipoprotein-sorting protein [bacterium]
MSSHRSLVLLGLSLLFSLSLAAADRPAVKEVLKKVDDLYRGATSQGEVSMIVETPDWKRTMGMSLWSEGMDKTFVVLRSPAKDAGVATLRVKRDMWNYFPRINKTLKVPPSMMMGSWMGSDFTNDDLVKESSLLDDYDAVWSKEEEPGTWALDLTPKARTATVWGRIHMILRAGTLIPLAEEYFDEHGEKVRIMKFSDVKKVGDRELPMTLELTPLKKPGNRTVLIYKSLEFDKPLPPSTFSLQNLRRAR